MAAWQVYVAYTDGTQQHLRLKAKTETDARIAAIQQLDPNLIVERIIPRPAPRTEAQERAHYQRLEKRYREQRDREFAEEAEWLKRLERPTVDYYATLTYPDGNTSSFRFTGPNREDVRARLRQLHGPCQITLQTVKRKRERARAYQHKIQKRPAPPPGTGWLLSTEVHARTELLDLEALADTLTQPDEPRTTASRSAAHWLHQHVYTKTPHELGCSGNGAAPRTR